jgi:hypothetical protein
MEVVQREDPPLTAQQEQERRALVQIPAAPGEHVNLGDVPPDQIRRQYSDGSDNPDEMKVVLEVMKDLADQEFERAERLSSKARQAFGFVSVLFAGVQAIVLTTLATYFVSDGEQWTVLTMAAIGVVLTAVTGVLAVAADALKSFANLSSDDVLDSANASLERGTPVAVDFTELYARALDERRGAVTRRRGWLVKAQVAAVITIVALAGELLYALYVRLPS